MKTRILLSAFAFVFAFVNAAAPALAGPVEDMLAADRAFAQMAQDENVPAAFAAYAAPDVRMFPEGAASYAGREAMIANFRNWPEGARLDWTPTDGAASEAGDFGYTWGRFVFSAQGADGPVKEYGKYVSIWRKEPDGAWKFIADIGNAGPAPQSP